MITFALKILLSNRGKLITALTGVVFSLVLVNVQGGLYLGLIHKASLLVDHTDADIWVGKHLVENVDLANDIPVEWLNRIRGLQGVALADPYIVQPSIATLPDGGFETLMIIGIDPLSKIGAAWNVDEGGETYVYRPDSITIDRLDARKLGYAQIGDIVEISGHRAKITGFTDGVIGFMTTPYVFTNIDSARQYAQIREGYCSYFLIQAADGVNLNELSDEIRHLVPSANVYTAAQFRKISQDYWMHRTGIGISFGMATVLGLLVGLLMVAQSLYALALDHVNDFATLKAIGAENSQILQVVLVQSCSIAVVGTLIGMGIVWVAETYCSTPLAPIEIPMILRVAGIGLVATICLVASVLPFQRLRRIDPAIVLQG